LDTREDGNFIKVLDFGVAKASVVGPHGEALETLAPPGFTVGTPQYMSPEQATGGCVDDRTGRVLARAPDPPLSARVRDVDPRLDELVHRMLQSDMEARLSAREVRRRRASSWRARVPRRELSSAHRVRSTEHSPVWREVAASASWVGPC
jgi:hypothetical protein